MRKFFPVILLFFFLLLDGCSNTSGGVIEEDSAYRVLKTTSGTTSEGTYTIELGETVVSGTIKENLSFGLSSITGSRYALAVIKNTSENRTAYQAMLAVGQTVELSKEQYRTYSVTGTDQDGSTASTFPIENATITADTKPDTDGFYYVCILGSLSDTTCSLMKNQSRLTVTLGSDNSVSFTVPYDFLYGLTAYLSLS